MIQVPVITILNNCPIFRVKNNGWISKPYTMFRGQRQGCPLSALTFILAVEILSIRIRKNPDIKGLSIGNIEHKIVQYADDATLILSDLRSIENSLLEINNFGNLAGPKLNIEKTKGIWLGSLKNLGLRKFCNITWTGNPVKCLGIYLGHNHEQCKLLNWNRKINNIKKVIMQWKQRSSTLTLQGKILIIKTLVLSKIVFPANLLPVPDDIIKELKQCIYEFIWGRRDRVKRSVISNKQTNGGLNMTHIDSFLAALKAAWVTRLINTEGNWKNPLNYYLQKLNIPLNFLLRMNFQDIKRFPEIQKLPEFYQHVFVAFNNVKYMKTLKKMSCYELLCQPIFGNELFKIDDKCLYFRSWLKSGIYYVRDLVGPTGEILSDKDMYNVISDKRNLIRELYIIKNTVVKHLHDTDVRIAHNIHISKSISFTDGKNIYTVKQQKSNFYYDILIAKCLDRPNFEQSLSTLFNFENSIKIWNSIYCQKMVCLDDNKLEEFNFKLLHNILPCGYILSKWNINVSDLCEVCNEVETARHMLYDCARVKRVWQKISNVLQIDIRWKHLLCGFIMCDITEKTKFLNMLFTIIMYGIFKSNNKCKYDNLSYRDVNLDICLKRNLIFYKNVLLCSKRLMNYDFRECIFTKCIEIL